MKLNFKNILDVSYKLKAYYELWTNSMSTLVFVRANNFLFVNIVLLSLIYVCYTNKKTQRNNKKSKLMFIIHKTKSCNISKIKRYKYHESHMDPGGLKKLWFEISHTRAKMASKTKDKLNYLPKLKHATTYPLWEKEVLVTAEKIIKVVDGKQLLMRRKYNGKMHLHHENSGHFSKIPHSRKWAWLLPGSCGFKPVVQGSPNICNLCF